MKGKYLWVSLLAIVLSFAGGFFFANALNRKDLNALKLENDRLKANVEEAQKAKNDSSLSDDELSSTIAKADQDIANFDLQKNTGRAIYRYGSMKKDATLIKESARILLRAHQLKKDDFDVTVDLGNAYFDIGYFGNDNESFPTSREFYNQALGMRPNDVEVRTDLGLSYFLQDPPDDNNAIAEFQKSLRIDPKHAKTLEFIIQSLIRQNRFDEAGAYLTKLREANPQDEALPGLEAKITESKGTQAK